MRYSIYEVIPVSLLNRFAALLCVLLSVCLVGGCRPAYTPRPVDTDAAERSFSLLRVPPLSQYPDYPTGCESVTAVMALRYAGISVGVEEFVDDYLPRDDRFFEADGLLYGPDPYAVFIGDPRSSHAYGCMAPVIEKALLSCIGKGATVVNTTGEALPTLCRNYVDKGIPVLLWATMEMRPVGSGKTWFLPDGRQFIWPAGEHCLLLVGYNAGEYFFNDPRHGATVAYDKKSVEVAYASLGKQSLVIQ